MKTRNIVPFGLRMPPELKTKLQAEAKKQPGGSLNAEIVARLQASFAPPVTPATFSDGELIDEIISRWGRDRAFIKLGSE